MRLVSTSLLALTLAIPACTPTPKRSVVVAHSAPVLGVRVVDITNKGGERPLVLRFWCGSSFTTWPISEALRIVVVEELGGKCGVYIQQRGATSKQEFELPTPKKDSQVTKTITTSTPTAADVAAGKGDVLVIQWSTSDHLPGKRAPALTLRFELLYE